MNHDMTFFGRRVLFIGAHPDDIEIGCGALIGHIVDQTEILCVTLSDNQKNPALVNLVDEHYRSMEVLGVPKEKIILGNFETRRFPHQRQEILEYILNLRHEFQPDIVFVHTKADIHQDHVTVTEKPCVLSPHDRAWYDVIRSSFDFSPVFCEVYEMTSEKIKALVNIKPPGRYTSAPSHPLHAGALCAICERPTPRDRYPEGGP